MVWGVLWQPCYQGRLAGEGIPCRRRARGLGSGWGVVQACGCGVQKLLQAAKGTRMKPTGAVTCLDHGRVGARSSNSNGRGCRRERADVGVRRSECVREGEGREAEATHHLLRRYRRRVFLILPGPIWGMRQRHVDAEGARWSRKDAGRAGLSAGGRGLGAKCSSAGLQFHAQQQRPGVLA